MIARGQTVAVAESLTGGELTALLTEPAGASAAVRGGVVAYATDTKALVAGVAADLLERVGPVDAEVACQLATGARTIFGATYGVGITGVAGPDPQHGHPVGEVHVAVAGPRGMVGVAHDFASLGARARIRQAAAQAGLRLLLQVMGEESS